MRAIVQKFINEYAAALDINPKEIGTMRVTNIDYLWNINAEREVNGIPVKDALLSISINHGNISIWGVEKWGDINVNLQPSLTKETAVNLGFNHIGGLTSNDNITVEPHLLLVPVNFSSLKGTPGKGYDYKLVWAFTFQREGYNNTWEMYVDAHSGNVLKFEDQNAYVAKRITGPIYPLSNDDCPPDGQAVYKYPMAIANTGFAAPNDFTSLYGIYDYTSGTVATTLAGKYVTITDNCGAINEQSATGDLDLGGTNQQHDCGIPADHSAGDTFSSRSGETEMTAINRIARGWVNFSWLDGLLTANMNINSTCNAFWNGTVNFYRTGGGCRNTGEIAAVFDHEWGHGIDQNDGDGGLSNPGEVYADVVSTVKLHNSCVGRGFWWTLNRNCGGWTCPTNSSSTGYNCGGYGNCCTNCTGIRDSDYAKHANGLPSTPINFNCNCTSTGSGPCGKEVHCENALGAETVWDIASRDLQASPFNLDKNTAFEVTTRLVYTAVNGIADWYACNCTGNTSDGCTAGSGYMRFINADDDDGNVNNGTPHMTAIANAYSRHGIGCSTPTPQNSGCASGPTTAPTLNAVLGASGAQLSWNSIPNATQYYVFKASGIWGCDIGKTKIATVTGTTYTDPDVGCDTVYYSVQPVGSNTACLGPFSNCATLNPYLPAPSSVTATATAANQVTVNWPSVSGASGYNVYRRYTLCGSPRIQKIAGPLTGNSYVDNTVSGNTTYDYAVTTLGQVVIACESTYSNWASATPTGVCKLEPCFSGITSATNNGTATCQINLAWGSATTNCSGSTAKFNIYRSTTPDFIPGSANRIAQCLTTTTYADMGISYGTRYYYIVRAEDTTTNGSGPCNNGNEDTNLNYKYATAAGPVVPQFTDNFETSWPGNWTATGNWTWNTAQSHSATHSAYGGPTTVCHYLTLTNFLTPPPGLPPSMTFWTRVDTMNQWNGGKVEASADGTTWTKLNVTPNYNGTKVFDEPCMASNEPCFTGALTTWTQETADFSSFNHNGQFKVRFTWAVRWTGTGNGWWVDDVQLSWGGSCTTQTSSTPGKVLNNLLITKSGTNLNLNWTAPQTPCTPTGYGLYRGTLPWTGYNHASVSCAITGTSTATPQQSGSNYYLIVPLQSTATREGSYGTSSSGTERPQGSGACYTQDTTSCN